MALIDCLAYIALLAMMLGLTVLAFFRASDNTRNLHRDVADIARVLHTGERWRDDVRSANGPPRLEQDGAAAVLRLPQGTGEISYAFRDGAVFRRALPNTNWLAALPAVEASVMQANPRAHVTSWRWDVELKGRRKVSGVRPVFSFEAVAKGVAKP